MPTTRARRVDDRQARDPVLLRELQHVAHGHVLGDRDRILDDAAFEALDLRDFGGLRARRHVLVNDADAAFLRDGDREPRFGDRVHRGRRDGDVQGDAAGQPRLEADFARQDGRVGGNQQYIVEGEGFLHHAHVSRPSQSRHYTREGVNRQRIRTLERLTGRFRFVMLPWRTMFAAVHAIQLAAAGPQDRSPCCLSHWHLCRPPAQVNKCLDGAARWSVTQPNVRRERVRNRPASGAHPPPASSSEKSLAERDAEFRKRQLEQKEAAEKSEKKTAEARERKEACEASQGYLKNLQAGNRIRKTDPKTGERELSCRCGLSEGNRCRATGRGGELQVRLSGPALHVACRTLAPRLLSDRPRAAGRSQSDRRHARQSPSKRRARRCPPSRARDRRRERGARIRPGRSLPPLSCPARRARSRQSPAREVHRRPLPQGHARAP